jgi:hypothetical protein
MQRNHVVIGNLKLYQVGLRIANHMPADKFLPSEGFVRAHKNLNILIIMHCLVTDNLRHVVISGL